VLAGCGLKMFAFDMARFGWPWSLMLLISKNVWTPGRTQIQFQAESVDLLVLD
jgi:hypothetical protein